MYVKGADKKICFLVVPTIKALIVLKNIPVIIFVIFFVNTIKMCWMQLVYKISTTQNVIIYKITSNWHLGKNFSINISKRNANKYFAKLIDENGYSCYCYNI